MKNKLRYLPEASFPESPYIPGGALAHPDSVVAQDFIALAGHKWKMNKCWLLGVDFFNHGYVWEAHEAWEYVWNAYGRKSEEALFVQAMIFCTAARVKKKQNLNYQKSQDKAGQIIAEIDPKVIEHWGIDISHFNEWFAKEQVNLSKELDFLYLQPH